MVKNDKNSIFWNIVEVFLKFLKDYGEECFCLQCEEDKVEAVDHPPVIPA